MKIMQCLAIVKLAAKRKWVALIITAIDMATALLKDIFLFYSIDIQNIYKLFRKKKKRSDRIHQNEQFLYLKLGLTLIKSKTKDRSKLNLDFFCLN